MRILTPQQQIKKEQEKSLSSKFLYLIRVLGLPKPESEYPFLQNRDFRFDFAWREQRIAVEIEGGVWTQGRHVRPQGYENDCEKYNLAALNGWLLLRFTESMLDDGTAAKQIEAAFDRSLPPLLMKEGK